jgi:hypothetical protein
MANNYTEGAAEFALLPQWSTPQQVDRLVSLADAIQAELEECSENGDTKFPDSEVLAEWGLTDAERIKQFWVYWAGHIEPVMEDETLSCALWGPGSTDSSLHVSSQESIDSTMVVLVTRILQFIHAPFPEVGAWYLTSSHRCDKPRADQFGGSVRVWTMTQDAYQGTQGMLHHMLHTSALSSEDIRLLVTELQERSNESFRAIFWRLERAYPGSMSALRTVIERVRIEERS